MGTTTKNQFSCRVGLYAPDIILLSSVLIAKMLSTKDVGRLTACNPPVGIRGLAMHARRKKRKQR
jgi:hypothetical protein